MVFLTRGESRRRETVQQKQPTKRAEFTKLTTKKISMKSEDKKIGSKTKSSNDPCELSNSVTEVTAPRTLRRRTGVVIKEMSNILENTDSPKKLENMSQITGSEMKDGDSIIDPPARKTRSSKANMTSLQTKETPAKKDISQRRSTCKSASKNVSKSSKDLLKVGKQVHRVMVSVDENVENIDSALNPEEAQTENNVSESADQVTVLKPEQETNVLSPVKMAEDSDINKVDILPSAQSTSKKVDIKRSTRKSAIKSSETKSNIKCPRRSTKLAEISQCPDNENIVLDLDSGELTQNDEVPENKSDVIEMEPKQEEDIPLVQNTKDTGVTEVDNLKDVESLSKEICTRRRSSRKSVINTSENTNITPKNLRRASVLVETSEKASLPVKSLRKASVPVESPGKASVLVESSEKASVPVESPGKASVPVKSPRKASVLVESPGEASAPVESSEKDSISIETTRKASVPVESSENDSVPVKSPGKTSVPVKSSGKDDVPIKSPGKASVPIETTGKASVPVESSENDSVPVKSPRRASARVRSPRRASVPVKSPGKVSVSVESSENDSVPVKSPGKAGVPVKSPGKVSVPVESTENDSVPVESSGKDDVPIKSPGKASVPVESSENDSVPVKSPRRASARVRSPRRASVPVKSPGKVSVSVESSENDSVPVKSPGKAGVPVKSPGKVSVPVESSGKASVPVESPKNDSVLVEDGVPMKSPEKANTKPSQVNDSLDNKNSVPVLESEEINLSLEKLTENSNQFTVSESTEKEKTAVVQPVCPTDKPELKIINKEATIINESVQNDICDTQVKEKKSSSSLEAEKSFKIFDSDDSSINSMDVELSGANSDIDEVLRDNIGTPSKNTESVDVFAEKSSSVKDSDTKDTLSKNDAGDKPSGENTTNSYCNIPVVEAADKVSSPIFQLTTCKSKNQEFDKIELEKKEKDAEEKFNDDSTEEDFYSKVNKRKSLHLNKRKKVLEIAKVFENNDISTLTDLPSDEHLELLTTEKRKKSPKHDSRKRKLEENETFHNNTIKQKPKKELKEKALKRKLSDETPNDTKTKKKTSNGILVIGSLPESVGPSQIKTLFSGNKIKLKKQKKLKTGGTIVQLEDWSKIGIAVSLLSEKYLGNAICINSLGADNHINQRNQSPTHDKMADIVSTGDINCKSTSDIKEAVLLSDEDPQTPKVDESCVKPEFPENVDISKSKKKCSRTLYVEGDFKEFTVSELSSLFDGLVILKTDTYIVVKFQDIKTAKKYCTELKKLSKDNKSMKVKYLPKLKSGGQ